MLGYLKNSDAFKKILLVIFLIIQWLMLIGILSNNLHIKKIYIVLFILFFICAIILRWVNLKEWLKSNMNTFMNYLKLALVYYSIFILGSMLWFDYKTVLHNAIVLSIMFIFALFLYNFICKNVRERKLILKLLKIFFTVFILLSTMIYNSLLKELSLRQDYFKNIIENTSNLKEKNEFINQYKLFLENKLELFSPFEILDNQEEDLTITKHKKREFHLFINLASAIIVLTIMFCLGLFINESIFFREKRTKPKIISYKKRNHLFKI